MMLKFFRANMARAGGNACYIAVLGAFAYFGSLNDKRRREELEAANPGYTAVHQFRPNTLYGGYFDLELRPKVEEGKTTTSMAKP